MMARGGVYYYVLSLVIKFYLVSEERAAAA